MRACARARAHVCVCGGGLQSPNESFGDEYSTTHSLYPEQIVWHTTHIHPMLCGILLLYNVIGATDQQMFKINLLYPFSLIPTGVAAGQITERRAISTLVCACAVPVQHARSTGLVRTSCSIRHIALTVQGHSSFCSRTLIITICWLSQFPYNTAFATIGRITLLNPNKDLMVK